MDKVAREEVRDLLLRVAKLEVEPKLIGDSWTEVYAGNVAFDVDGWRVEVFNDCDAWDYIDKVVAPDGREGQYEDWSLSAEEEDEQWTTGQPDDALGELKWQVVEIVIKAAGGDLDGLDDRRRIRKRIVDASVELFKRLMGHS